MLHVESRFWRLSRLDLRPVLSPWLGMNVGFIRKEACKLDYGYARKGCLTLFIVKLSLTRKSQKLDLCAAEIIRADFGSNSIRVCLRALKITIVILMHISAEICLFCVDLELLITPECKAKIRVGSIVQASKEL